MPALDALSITTHSAAQTRALGCHLGPALVCGAVIALHGDLGAGKTLFVQGLAQGMEVLGRVASPTFIIMRAHPSGRDRVLSFAVDCALYHVDAYRLESGHELWEMGLEDWLDNGAVAIEWAERVQEALPADRLDIRFTILGDERELTLTAGGPQSRRLLEHLQRCGY